MPNSYRNASALGRLVCALYMSLPYAAAASVPQPTDRIVGIEIHCDEPVYEEELRRLLPFDVGDLVEPALLEEARRRLQLREVFETVSVESQPAPGGQVVRLKLKRLPLVNLIRFSGNDTLGDEELRRASRLRTGSPLTSAAKEYASGQVRAAYEAAGFVAARVEVRIIEIVPGEVDVRFEIVEGEPLTITSVEIEGVEGPLKQQLTDEVDLGADDRYAKAAEREAVEAIVKRLREEKYYEARVKPSWQAPTARHGQVVFRIEPGPVFDVEFSGASDLSSEDLLETMNLLERPIITDGTWRELARRAVRAYQEQGYHEAKVKLTAIETRAEPVLEKKIRFEVKEGSRFRVRKVDFEGNESIPVERLRAAMQTRPPSWIPWSKGALVDQVLAEDLERIVALCRGEGFVDGKIDSTDINHDNGAIDLLIHLHEGSQVSVRDLQLVGFEGIADSLPALETQVGAPFDQRKVESDRLILATVLAAAGYPGAEVSAEAKVDESDTGRRAASVKISARPGERVRIGNIIVQNNFDTQSKVVLHELPFRSGDILAPDQLLRGQGEVYKLGLFRNVTVRSVDEPPDPAVRDVVVRVVEKPPGSFQWGVGYNTRDGFRGVGQVGYHNLQGLDRSISLRGQLDVDVADASPNQYLGDVSYRAPHLFDTLSAGSLKFVAQRSQRDIDDFKLERFALIPGLERPLWERIVGGVALQIDQTRIFDLAADIAAESASRRQPCIQDGDRFLGSCPFDDEGRFFSVSLDPFLIRNGLDDELRPTSGMFESVRMRFAPSQLGTEVPLVKLVGQHSHYIPIGDYFTFIYALRFGWARTTEDDRQVPIQERFFLGGRTTVRGFSENSLGPEARCDPNEPDEDKCAHSPLGGDVSINLNGEVHFPVLYGLRGAVFVDGGGVYLQTHNAKGEDFRETAGVGLRYMTPVGPLSLDYGFKLDRGDSESLGQIHFSVGRVF